MALAQHGAGDPRLFGRTGPHGLAAIADTTGAGLPGGGPDRMLHGIVPLRAAGPAKPSFMDDREYVETLAATLAGTVIVHPDLVGHLRVGAKARVGAQAGVMADPKAGADVAGSPAQPIRESFRGVATLRRLARRLPATAAARPE